MVGKKIAPVSRDELISALNVYKTRPGNEDLIANQTTDENVFELLRGDVSLKVAYVDGQLKPNFNDAKFEEAIIKLVMEGREDGPQAPRLDDRAKERAIRKAVNGPGQSIARSDMPTRDIQVQDLTFEDIKTYICPTSSDQEAMIFLKLCKARNLNPFLKEAYLVKYDQTKPAQMVTGKDHFTKTAEEHPQFDGFRAGIIVETDGKIELLEGTFMGSNSKLVGGWAEISRKDRKLPFKQTCSLKEFDKGMANWKTMPATMIRKCALVQALRECFPSQLAGCYDKSEVNLNGSVEIGEA